jgi:hypothetical protein
MKFKMLLILSAAIVFLTGPELALAATEGDTITTENTQCSQTIGSCTVTTLFWQFISGRWQLISFTEVQIPLPPGMTPKDRVQ